MNFLDNQYGSNRDRLVLFVVFFLLLIGPWMLGGRANGSLLIFGCFAWAAFGVNLSARKLKWRDLLGARKFRMRKSILAWSWLALFVILGLSVLNSSAHPYVASDGVTRLRIDGAFPFLPSSVYAWRTFQHGFFFSGCIVLAWSAFQVFNRRGVILALLTAIVMNGCILAVMGLYFDAIRAELIFNRFESVNASFFSSFRYHNHWGVYALICLSSSFAVWETKRGSWRGPEVLNRNIMFVALWAILAFSVVAAGGRFCLVGLSVLIAFFCFRFMQIQAFRRSNQIGGIIAIAVVVLGALWLAGDNFSERFEQTRDQLEGAVRGELNDTRFYAAPRDTIRMALDKPIWGWGMGSYLYIFREYAGPEFYIPHHGKQVLVWMEAAHNDWLQLWAEVGLVGVFLVFAPVLGFAVYSVKNGHNNPMTSWLLLLFVIVGFIACFDFPMANPVIALHVWVFGALVGKYAILEKRRYLESESS